MKLTVGEMQPSFAFFSYLFSIRTTGLKLCRVGNSSVCPAMRNIKFVQLYLTSPLQSHLPSVLLLGFLPMSWISPLELQPGQSVRRRRRSCER